MHFSHDEISIVEIKSSSLSSWGINYLSSISHEQWPVFYVIVILYSLFIMAILEFLEGEGGEKLFFNFCIMSFDFCGNLSCIGYAIYDIYIYVH